jgi:protein RecA
MSIEDLMAQLDKEIGKNSSGQKVENFINTGYPPLNKIMSGKYDGGLPFGRMIEIYGASGSGKTAIATQCMINAQKLGGIAIFIDWERSFDVDMAVSMGLNPERPYWIYDKAKTWEAGNMLAAKACKLIRQSRAIPDSAPIIVVFDSIAAAIPQSSSEKEIDTLTMNDTSALARVTSTTLKYQAQFAEEYNATFLYLNQIREKLGILFGPNTTTPGGRAMEYYATVRLQISRKALLDKTSEDGGMTGQNITIKCTKSKMTAPFKTCELLLSFDDTGKADFDMVTSLIDYLAEQGIIEVSGTRIVWEGSKLYKKEVAKRIHESGEYKKLVDMLKDA